LGGTGYVKTNGVSSFPNYQTRLAANLAQSKPDVVLVSGSINDGTGVTNPDINLPPAAQGVYDTIKATVPNAKVFVVTFANFRQPDGFFQTGPAAANLAIQTTAVNHAAVTAYRDLSYLLTGWGRVGIETGNGTQDVMVSSDGAHPTPLGHEVFGREIAGLIEAGLEGGVTPASVMPTGSTGPVLADTMNDTNGVTIQAHTPTNVGQPTLWAINTARATTDMVIDTNRLRRNANVQCFAYHPATLAADCYMEADLVWFSRLTSNASGIILRGGTTADTGIWGFYLVSAGQWQLMDVVAGAGTQIGSGFANTPSGPVQVRMECQGTAVRLYLDGVLRISATTTITGAGKAGLRDNPAAAIPATGTGCHYENIVAKNYP
jgi:lysophospholipase L1-like esterase